ncbi:MAG: hypothetical protein HZB11_03120 [Candidatus Yonathbacteria bacterium]|nr:hypothetical protein [Candidatus Yonathbacteria bacterium]
MEYNNNLTPTGLAHKLIHELKILGDLLSTTVQKLIIKKFYEYILEHRSSIAEVTNLLPLEAALVVILVREHQAFYHEISELHKRMDELERENKELKKILNEEI